MARERHIFELAAEDRTEAAFRSLKRSMGDVSHSVVSLNSVLGTLGAGLSAGALVAYTRNVVNSIAALDDLSESTGASVESFSRLTQIAKIGGRDVGSVETAVLRLNKALAGSDEDTQGAAEAFKAIGLSAQDLRRLQPDQALEAIAKAMDRFSDGAGKAAAGQAIFDKQWKEIAPLLHDIAETGGVVARVTAEQAAEAERLQKAWGRLRVETEGIAQAIAVQAVPAMNDWLAANLEAVRIAGGLGEALRLFVFNLDAMTTEKPAEEIRRLTKALEDYQQASSAGKFIQSPTGFLFGGREEDLKKQIELLKFLQRQEALAGAAALGDTSGERGALARAGIPTHKPGVPFTAPAEDTAKKLKAELDRLRAEDLKGWVAYADEVLRLADEENRALAAIAEDRLGEEERLRQLDIKGWVAHADEVLRLADEENLALARMAEESKKVSDAARDLGLTFQSAFEDAVLEGKNLSEVLKGLEKDIARVILRKTVTEPLTGAVSKGLDKLFKSFSFGGGDVGGLAGGGPVWPGQPVWVGERGPELLVPGGAGHIVPLDQLGGGQNFQISIDARGAELGVETRIRAAVQQAVQLSVAAVRAQADRGGSYARALGRR